MKRFAKAGVIFFVVVVVLFVGALVIFPRAYSPYIKRIVIEILEDKFDGKVAIKDLQVVPFPHVYVEAHGITLQQNGRTDVPPLLMIDKLSISSSVIGLLRKHKRVSGVHLQGLQIHVPPRSDAPQEQAPQKKNVPDVVIDEITSEDALLETLPRDPNKIPRDFEIHQLVINNFGFDRSAHFHAVLTNPAPDGLIDSLGEFGPWHADEPGDTPISATYTFSHADMATLRGLSGILSSTGKYAGTLDHLDVEGDTNTPDFALNISGNPVPLKTHFVAVVDGTNGDTFLKSVDAVLGTSKIHCSGQVVGIKGVRGRSISILAEARGARIEDFLMLAVKGDKPLMRGSVNLRFKMDLPPRPGEDILSRLGLDGQFGIAGAQFTDPNTQEKLDSLSRRGQGHPKDEDIQDVISNLRGRFAMGRGTIRFSNLQFDVPGAGVQLAGSYNMDKEEVNFHGHLLLDAKISQTVTGVKSIFLTLADPFFSKNGGGSSIPIKVVGHRSHPDFGLDLGHNDSKKGKSRTNNNGGKTVKN